MIINSFSSLLPYLRGPAAVLWDPPSITRLPAAGSPALWVAPRTPPVPCLFSNARVLYLERCAWGPSSEAPHPPEPPSQLLAARRPAHGMGLGQGCMGAVWGLLGARCLPAPSHVLPDSAVCPREGAPRPHPLCLQCHLSACPSVRPSTHPSLHPSIHPPIHPSIHLSRAGVLPCPYPPRRATSLPAATRERRGERKALLPTFISCNE